MKKHIILLWIAILLFASPTFAKKLVLVVVSKDGCHWCERLERESLHNPKIRKEIEKHFMIAEISRNSGNIPSFLDPTLFPTIYILDTDGEKFLFTIVGYQKSSELLSEIEEVYERRFGSDE